MNRHGASGFYITALVAVIAVALLWIGHLTSDCDSKHGVLVRGAFGLTCIEEGQH